MPFGFSGFGYGSRPQPATRLTLEDLLAEMQAAQQQPQLPPRPEPLSSVSQLEGEDRKRAQRESLWAALAAMGAGLSSGNQGYTARGVGDIAAVQQGAVEGANRRRQSEWEAQAQDKIAQIEAAQKEQQTAALFGVYQKIAAAEPPESPFVRRAETAARTGSMAELQDLLGQLPKRAAARRRGYDPDLWESNQQLEADLAAEIENQKKAATWEAELARKREQEKMEMEAKLEEERALRAEQLGSYKPPQYEPLSRIEAIEQIRAKYRDGGAGGMRGRLGQAPGGQWGWISPPTEENPSGKFTPIDGQPQEKGTYHIFTVQGQPFAIDRQHPELGAFELPVNEGQLPPAGRKGGAGGKEKGTPVAIPGDPHPERPLERRLLDVEAAVGKMTPEEKAQAAALLRSMLPRDVVAGIRRARAGG